MRSLKPNPIPWRCFSTHYAYRIILSEWYRIFPQYAGWFNRFETPRNLRRDFWRMMTMGGEI